MSQPAVKISDLARARPPAHADAPDYLDGLNPEQRAAVLAVDGPVLVLAGAGTGKTRVLTTRLAHILNSGLARPWQLLAVTFTNKAAREMKERIGHLIGPQAEGLRWVGTFHSVSAQILRRHAELVGLKSTFAILDVDDQERVLKGLIEDAGLDPKRWTAKSFVNLIDGWKNRGWLPADLPAGEAAYAQNKAGDLYAAYQARLRSLNACDFGDLLLHNITIFRAHPDVLAEYHDRFRYMLVDEYQDTNVAQYLWLRLLAQKHRNVCCVGDDDQSIYGWRGAEVDNILRFERDFPGAQVIRLERNYRSTGHILAAASGLIASNKSRLGKTLWTEGDQGEKVRVRGVWDGEAEAKLIADDIESWKRQGRRYRDVAILVRAAFQMRAFEERFVLLQIPYAVIGGPRFFERAEIRDAHAYLRLIVSEDDDLAFERIVNQPKRGIGDTTVAKLLQLGRANGVSASLAARGMVRTDELAARTRTSLANFLRDVDRWRGQLASGTPHHKVLETLLEESGYVDMLRADKATGATRLDNLKELATSMAQFDTLGAYLEHVSLVLDLDRGPAADAVQVMTLHAAKGLEFPLVFLPGWEEGVFPSQRSMDESGEKGLEEERRLAYVGLTRAREDARVSFAANRQVYGRWTSQLPSRFVDELPLPHVEAISDTGYYGGGPGMSTPAQSRWDAPDSPFAHDRTGGYNSPGWRRAQTHLSQREREGPAGAAGGRVRGSSFSSMPAGLRPASSLNRNREPIEGDARLIAVSTPSASAGYAIGARVFHQKFGPGTVTFVEGNKLTVSFDKAGKKKVIDTFVSAS